MRGEMLRRLMTTLNALGHGVGEGAKSWGVRV